ncbi:MAG: hypothetical protein HKN20_07130, partial [Gemmatimonadetes bacterium]|nr:hypothetical protein [Gemmatimonadota bacterium]
MSHPLSPDRMNCGLIIIHNGKEKEKIMNLNSFRITALALATIGTVALTAGNAFSQGRPRTSAWA